MKFPTHLQVDRGDALPVGAPTLLMSFTENRHIDPTLVEGLLKKYGGDIEDNIRDREDIPGPDEVTMTRTLILFFLRVADWLENLGGDVGDSIRDREDIPGPDEVSRAGANCFFRFLLIRSRR